MNLWRTVGKILEEGADKEAGTTRRRAVSTRRLSSWKQHFPTFLAAFSLLRGFLTARSIRVVAVFAMGGLTSIFPYSIHLRKSDGECRQVRSLDARPGVVALILRHLLSELGAI